MKINDALNEIERLQKELAVSISDILTSHIGYFDHP